jgi:hypothetical protein
MKPKKSIRSAKERRRRGPNHCRLESRLLSYGIAAGALFAGGAVADASVMEFDFSSPPTTPVNGVPGDLFFSLQNGTFSTIQGTNSFKLRQRSSNGTNFAGSAFGLAAGASVDGLGGYAFKVNPNSTVGPLKNFSSFGALANKTGLGLTGGVWKPGDLAFLGLKFDVSGDTHYGWAEVMLNNDYTVTLYGVAYETVKDTAITAPATFVPEPNELALLAVGAAGLAIVRKRRKSKAT